jgi:hypothetical protein
MPVENDQLRKTKTRFNELHRRLYLLPQSRMPTDYEHPGIERVHILSDREVRELKHELAGRIWEF